MWRIFNLEEVRARHAQAKKEQEEQTRLHQEYLKRMSLSRIIGLIIRYIIADFRNGDGRKEIVEELESILREVER
jgi:hypothetical protein